LLLFLLAGCFQIDCATLTGPAVCVEGDGGVDTAPPSAQIHRETLTFSPDGGGVTTFFQVPAAPAWLRVRLDQFSQDYEGISGRLGPDDGGVCCVALPEQYSLTRSGVDELIYVEDDGWYAYFAVAYTRGGGSGGGARLTVDRYDPDAFEAGEGRVFSCARPDCDYW